MSIIDTIQTNADVLTPSEKRLIDAVVGSPRQAALETVSELAQRAGVHEATASRLSRKLGYAGFSAFRAAIREEFIPTREPATRLQRTLEQSEPAAILDDLVHQEIDALSRLSDYVESAAVIDVARRMMKARTVYLFAQGNAEPLALLMLKRFRRFGKDVRALSGDPRELAEQTLTMGARDVLLGFAFRQAPPYYATLRELAREHGTHTVVISGLTGATLTPAPDLLLAAPRTGDADGFQSLTVPMTLCNAVVLAAGALQNRSSLSALEVLGERIERFQ